MKTVLPLIMISLFTLCGCAAVDVATKNDKLSQSGPSKDENLLSGATVRAEGASEIVVDKTGFKIKGMSSKDGTAIPAKAEIQFNKMSNQYQDEGNMNMETGVTGVSILRVGQAPYAMIRENQGIQANDTPWGDFWSGKQEGYGVLEKFWEWLKRAFWLVMTIVLIIGIGLTALCIFPVTRPIGLTIVRLLISFIPGLPTKAMSEWFKKMLGE